MSKNNKSSNIQRRNKIPKINLNKIITLILVVSTMGAIITIASVVFFPGQQNGFSELSLLMYDNAEGTYVANNFPEDISQDDNVTVFFMVKNFENKVTYYQIQIKVTEISQNISLVEPLSLSNSRTLYINETFEKILSPATDNEKEESGVLAGQYIWGPVNVTLFMNNTLEYILGGADSLKFVFELWKYDPLGDNFQYSGIFTFLELSYN
ncbi:MAG: DUF1616 domain-containing protein [Candidatus Heimdallarchaeota archaeon]|nr:DUF1616 domain-containing protein [Candidatus Heimdallarchaeota archaeon]